MQCSGHGPNTASLLTHAGNDHPVIRSSGHPVLRLELLIFCSFFHLCTLRYEVLHFRFGAVHRNSVPKLLRKLLHCHQCGVRSRASRHGGGDVLLLAVTQGQPYFEDPAGSAEVCRDAAVGRAGSITGQDSLPTQDYPKHSLLVRR